MTKAAKFDAFLAENKITCFSKEEVKNDLHTVVYRAHMEVSGQMLPLKNVFLAYSSFKCAGLISPVMPANK